LLHEISKSVNSFIQWLENYGETSYDYQTLYSGPVGGKAKALYYRNSYIGKFVVLPMVFCEAAIPSARRFLGPKLRFPIADAHYAMGFAFLAENDDSNKYYEKAVRFLEALEKTRSPGYKHYCWGYPFDWVTRNGTVPAGTPLITSTPYAYEAFQQVYELDRNEHWKHVMHSIAEHAFNDIDDFKIDPVTSSCGYMPGDRQGGVVNASAYRAFLLTSASLDFSEPRYWEKAERNLNFVLKSQMSDGSWCYAADEVRDFVDHFHTCFVLKALAKIEKITGNQKCRKSIEKGVQYYTRELFDDKSLPKPFSQAPRITVYRKELYDYAECINLGTLLRGQFEKLDEVVECAIHDVITRWQKPDGSFRSRKLYLGWDNVPMHRWAQSQLFNSLSFFLHEKC